MAAPGPGPGDRSRAALSRNSKKSGAAKHNPTSNEAGIGTHHVRIPMRRPSQAAHRANERNAMLTSAASCAAGNDSPQ